MGKLVRGSAWRLAIAVVALIGLSGCSSTPSVPSATPAAPPSATASAIVSPTAMPTPTPSPTPAPPLTFVATGSLHTARSSATATLLKNGKVLIAGGMLDRGLAADVYATAELYDPATGKFTPTGSMTAARSYATATLLRDGRVLIAGGEGCSKAPSCHYVAIDELQHLASADLYDPATGKFTATGSMSGPSEQDTAMQLPDGRVLLTGWNQWAEIYDPNSGNEPPWESWRLPELESGGMRLF